MNNLKYDIQFRNQTLKGMAKLNQVSKVKAKLKAISQSMMIH